MQLALYGLATEHLSRVITNPESSDDSLTPGWDDMVRRPRVGATEAHSAAWFDPPTASPA